MKLIDPIFNRTKTGFITINHHKILFSMKNAQNVVSREDVNWENDACWWNVQGSGKCGKKQPSGIKSSTVTRFSMEISCKVIRIDKRVQPVTSKARQQ